MIKRKEWTTNMTTDSVRLPVIHFLYRFTPEAILAGASISDGKIRIVVANGGFAPTYCTTNPGSTFPVEYIADRYNVHGGEDPLYQSLENTLTNEEYTDEMRILRLRMLKQKGDTQ